MEKLEPAKLPRILRSVSAEQGRCPRCNTVLRRLGDTSSRGKVGTEQNRIEEKGFGCPNDECSAKVIEKYDRSGLPAYREVVDPDPVVVKRVENLMKAEGERKAAIAALEATPEKLKEV